MHQCLNAYYTYVHIYIFPQNAFSDHFALQLPADHKEIVEVTRCILFSEVLKLVMLLDVVKAVAVVLLLVPVLQGHQLAQIYLCY